MQKTHLSLLISVFLTLTWSTKLAGAQNASELFQKAPPHVDQALRARVQQFYQLQVEGKFSQAYEMVAPESKEDFFRAAGNQFKSCEVAKVVYEENFTRARVVVACEVEFTMPYGAKRFNVKAPFTSFWRLENGQWVWYLPKRDAETTPFGDLHPGQGTSQPAGFQGGITIEQLLQGVQLEKSEIRFQRDQAGEEEVRVVNHLPGPAEIQFEGPKVDGLTIEPQTLKLGPNETGTIKIAWEPHTAAVPSHRNYILRFVVMPMNRVLALNVVMLGQPASSVPASPGTTVNLPAIKQQIQEKKQQGNPQ